MAARKTVDNLNQAEDAARKAFAAAAEAYRALPDAGYYLRWPRSPEEAEVLEISQMALVERVVVLPDGTAIPVPADEQPPETAA